MRSLTYKPRAAGRFVLERLKQGPATATELARAWGKPLTSFQKTLVLLRQNGMVDKSGRLYSLSKPKVASAFDLGRVA